MDTAESRIVNNMQIKSESEDDDHFIKPNVKMSESFSVGNEWSEQVVGNEYDWSEPEVGTTK